MLKRIICLFKGHAWGAWRSTYQDLPRIVTSTLEYLNSPEKWFRICTYCLKLEMKLTKPAKEKMP